MPLLVDYFVICGAHTEELEKDAQSVLSSHLHPFTRSYTPRVLAHYPDRAASRPFDEAAVRTLCMPDGLTFKKNLPALHGDFHSFLITRENGTRAYGSVLLFYELVQDTKLQNMLESLQTKYRESRRPGTNIEEDSFFNRAEDKLYTSKCICFVTAQPIFRPLRAYLEQLYAVATAREKTAELPLESYLYNILYEVSLPPPGKTVRLSGPLGQISWRQPSQVDFPLCDYSFRELFRLLGVRNVVKLLACVLLEHQILLKSAEYENLMMCAQCCTALLFPFLWPHVFVPILPASQRGFLDAPVPYIMGLRVEPNSSEGSLRYLNIPNESSLCMVDIDQGTMTIPEELPGLPDIERLVLQVSEKVQEHSVECPDIQDLPSLPSTPSSPETSTPTTKHSIIQALRFMQEIHSSRRGSDPKQLTDELSSLDNPHITTLLNIAARAGIKIPLLEATKLADIDEGMYEGTDDAEEEEEEEGKAPEKKTQWDYAPSREEEGFASAVREVFMSYFVEHFANYENFIIMPRQSYDQWVRNREQFQNFDNTAFLSDQPSIHRPFYSTFLETSMFIAFIDKKIMAFWDSEQAGQALQLFDSRVEAYRAKSGLAKPPTTPGSRTDSTSSDASGSTGEGVIEETAPLPHELAKEGEARSQAGKAEQLGLFTQLDATLLQGKKPSEGSPPLLEDVIKSRVIGRPLSATSRGSIPGSPRLPLPRRHRNSGSSGSGFSSYSHAKFVNQLWRESRLRVKHMLGSTGESQNHIEENTHIAYLCDLLERIWGHGLKKRESKSPLWSHLMAYAETAGKEELLPASHPSPLTYSRELTQSMFSLPLASSAATTAGDESPRTQNLRAHFRRRKFQSPQLRARLEAILQPPSSTLFSDLLIVHNMRELKTDVGHARAWVRLSLEKKSLSRHLSQLLSNDELCSRRYREYAFLRTEEEREQFLYHLLTLTARDFNCFTTGFLNTTMTYRILVVAEGKHFGLSTACLYVNLAGELAETGVTEIPRGEYQIDITHRNLGPLTCLRIGHDNSGITPSLMVEMVLVHNLTTGQTHRFNCGRWFARAEDDGSVERFLVAVRVPQTVIKSGTMSALLDVDSILPSPERRRKAAARTEDKPMVADIKHSLKSVVEKIGAVCQGRNRDTTQEMLLLLHGPEGFVKSMDQVLQLGFKCIRRISKRLFVWDLLERVHEQLLSETPATGGDGEGISPRQMFLSTVTRINLCNPNIGKEEKATQLLCIGLRDHYLTNWISLIAQNSVTQGLYEPTSFFLNLELLQFLLDTLALTHPLIIKLEPLLIQGLHAR